MLHPTLPTTNYSKNEMLASENQWEFSFYFTWGKLHLMTTYLLISNISASTDLHTNLYYPDTYQKCESNLGHS